MKAGSIYIKGTQQSIELKHDASFPFTLTKSIAEIQDLSSRDKTHSKTFVIPATESNIKALGYPHVLGTDLDSIAVFKQGCLVIVNGNVIDEGFLYILNARKGVNVTEFECQFIGGSEPWVIALQNLYMKDVQYDSSGSALSVLYSDDNIRDRYLADPRTYANPEYLFINPYMYQFSDNTLTLGLGPDTYTGASRNAKGDDFWACFRLDKLIDGIFGTATNPLVTYVNSFQSFQFSSVFFQQNDTGVAHGFWDNIYYSDRSEDEYLTGSGAQVVANGALNIWGDFLPREMSMLDFFMQCVKTFNLVFDFDGITLRVEPRQNWTSWNGTEYTGFYSGSVDWSDKLSIEQEVQYKTSNYKRQIRLTYETDSYPVDASEYPYLSDKNINQPEVRYLIDIENNAEEGISDIVLPFNTSPSKFYQAKFDYKRKNGQTGGWSTTRVVRTDSITFDPGVKYANRLFVFKAGSKPLGVLYSTFGDMATSRLLVQDPRWRNWTYEEEDGTTHVNSSYPYIYNVITVNPFAGSAHVETVTGPGAVTTITGAQSDWDTVDNVDPVNPTISGGSAVGDPMTNIVPTDPDDINLGIYKSNTVNMPDGLYERFWKSTIDLLKVSRTLVTRVHMTRNEFVTLDQSKFYTALGQVFILNKVSDFDPLLDEQMVEVELLMANAVRGSEITTPEEATLLLDQHGEDCLAAYGLRKLRTAYTGSAIRIRRHSDNAEQDIGFDSNGDLDTGSITSFVGANSASVVTWYEQSGQASDWNLTQPTTSRQPRITDSSGNIFTLDGKPAIDDTNNSAARLSFNTTFGNAPSAINQPFHTFNVVSYPSTGDRVLFDGESGDCKISAYYGGVYRMGAGTNKNTGSTTINTQLLVDGSFNGASSYLFENNVSQGTSLNIGTNNINGFYLMGKGRLFGKTQEFLIYNAEISSTKRTNIATNINTHYSIY